jgi:hypothetical protein
LGSNRKKQKNADPAKLKRMGFDSDMEKVFFSAFSGISAVRFDVGGPKK